MPSYHETTESSASPAAARDSEPSPTLPWVFDECLPIPARGDGVSLEIRVQLASRELTLPQLLGLRVGKIVEFDQRTASPVRVFAAGRLIALGQIVRCGESVGVRILETFTD